MARGGPGKAHREGISLMGVNRRPKLTPDRRAKLTPSERPGGSCPGSQ